MNAKQSCYITKEGATNHIKCFLYYTFKKILNRNAQFLEHLLKINILCFHFNLMVHLFCMCDYHSSEIKAHLSISHTLSCYLVEFTHCKNNQVLLFFRSCANGSGKSDQNVSLFTFTIQMQLKLPHFRHVQRIL